MRNKSRIPRLLILLNDIWIDMPDTRFHQLIENLKSEYAKHVGWNKIHEIYEIDDFTYTQEYVGRFIDMFNLEDDDFIDFLENYKEFIKQNKEKINLKNNKHKGEFKKMINRRDIP